MSKTCGLAEVLVKNDECRQIQPVGSMIQPLANCTAILQFARGLRESFTQQKQKADRIMAGQNYAESNAGAPVLNDSVRP
jgi:hypothetical protein